MNEKKTRCDSVGKGMTDIISIKNLGDYIDIIDGLYNGDSTRGLWFRGHSKKDYNLIPSVYRTLNSKYSAERIYDDFYKRAGLLLENAPPRENTGFWLAKAQHYGLPTKLLDWSNSPLIALYFVLENKDKFNADGCVWVLDAAKLNITQIGTDSAINLDQITVNEYSNSTNKKDVKACWPVNNDSRVVAQQSRFTFHNCDVPMERDKRFAKLLIKIIIPHEYKEKLKEQLTNCGIREHSVYPDLGHTAQYVKRIRGFT